MSREDWNAIGLVFLVAFALVLGAGLATLTLATILSALR